jgi:hypothetical protein
MEKLSWIKELVKAEQQMEESGMVDITFGFDPEKILVQETLQFLLQLKDQFIDSSNSFNELKSSALGRTKIYGIAKTHADFMLFRNGFKMIFSLKAAGVISIRFNFIGASYIPGQNPMNGALSQHNFVDGAGATSGAANAAASSAANTAAHEEQLLEAKWGPFEEILWTYQGQSFKTTYLVRHYLSRFIRESSK